jgi:hypothetical protein
VPPSAVTLQTIWPRTAGLAAGVVGAGEGGATAAADEDAAGVVSGEQAAVSATRHAAAAAAPTMVANLPDATRRRSCWRENGGTGDDMKSRVPDP